MFWMKSMPLFESKMYHYAIFTGNGRLYMKNSATEIRLFFPQPVSNNQFLNDKNKSLKVLCGN